MMTALSGVVDALCLSNQAETFSIVSVFTELISGSLAEESFLQELKRNAVERKTNARAKMGGGNFSHDKFFGLLECNVKN